MKTVVHIRKKNNIYATVHSDDRGFLMSLYEHFSRYVDGYAFSPKFKAKVWDGKIRFFNRATGEVMIGIVNRVIDFCKDNDVTVKLDKEIINLFNDDGVILEDVQEYINSLEISNGEGELLEIRDYQQEAIYTIVKRVRRKIASPTSSGKSVILYGATRYLLDHEKIQGKILVVVPTIALTRQLKSDFAEYSMINGWDVKNDVTCIGGGLDDDSGVVVVSTWQSLIRKKPEFFEQFEALFIDEAHEADTKSMVSIAKICDARYRIGLSGSFEGDETTDMTLSGIFGNTSVTIKTREMIDRGYASHLDIHCIRLKHKDIPPDTKKMSYQDEMQYLAKNPKRNKFILDLAEGLEGNTLILFQLVEKQGKILYEAAKKTSNKKVFFIYGGVDVDEREQIRKILEKEKNCILLASYRTFATGSNVKNLENIIFGSPTKAFTRVIQSIGRGLRLNKGKTKCDLYDLFDYMYGDPKDMKTCNYTFEHFKSRIKIYIDEKHPYDVIPEYL